MSTAAFDSRRAELIAQWFRDNMQLHDPNATPETIAHNIVTAHSVSVQIRLDEHDGVDIPRSAIEQLTCRIGAGSETLYRTPFQAAAELQQRARTPRRRLVVSTALPDGEQICLATRRGTYRLAAVVLSSPSELIVGRVETRAESDAVFWGIRARMSIDGIYSLLSTVERDRIGRGRAFMETNPPDLTAEEWEEILGFCIRRPSQTFYRIINPDQPTLTRIRIATNRIRNRPYGLHAAMIFAIRTDGQNGVASTGYFCATPLWVLFSGY